MKVIVGRPRARVHALAASFDTRHLVEIDKDDVHPADLVAHVAKLREEDDTAVVLTNNPYVVDRFRADEVTVVGETGAKLLSEHPEFATWSSVLMPGEFWSSVGEDWVDA